MCTNSEPMCSRDAVHNCGDVCSPLSATPLQACLWYWNVVVDAVPNLTSWICCVGLIRSHVSLGGGHFDDRHCALRGMEYHVAMLMDS
jgi:hypothetical protein